jgi:hypothetical protein
MICIGSQTLRASAPGPSVTGWLTMPPMAHLGLWKAFMVRLTQVFARVTTLVWLDLSVDECLSNLMHRGQSGGGTDDQFEELLAYARAYRDRQNLNSYDGHRRLFAEFGLTKIRLSNRADISAFHLAMKKRQLS